MRKPERSRALETPRSGWEDNIKMGFREVGWGTWTASLWFRIQRVGELL